MLLFSSY